MKFNEKVMMVLAVVFVILLPAVGYSAGGQVNDNPLSYWNNGDVKHAIVSFVNAATTPGSKSFVPIEDRLATFDMDGTIACEKPLWLEMAIAKEQLKKIAGESPSARANQPYKAAYEGDDAFLIDNFLLAMATPFTGWTVTSYQRHVAEFMTTNQHPRFNMKYKDLFYLPMLQLIDYLESKDFTVYIVSGSNLLLVRSACYEKFGQESSHCIGTIAATTVIDYAESGPQLAICGYSFGPSDVEEGKVQNIFDLIGKFPVLAFGNTDGDFEMLMSTDSDKYLLLNHDDDEREYSYPEKEYKRKNWLGTAQENGWRVVSMKKDFKVVFPSTSE